MGSYSFLQTSAGPRESETHGGDDVVIYASGPASDLFHTTHEQSYIAHVMAYAACVGPYVGEDEEDPLCQASKTSI